MKFKHGTDNVTGACGVSALYGFAGDGYSWSIDSELTEEDWGGAGLTCAGFINTKGCRKAFYAIKQQAKVVYMSSVRVNRKSGNEFFFAVFEKCDGKPRNRGYVWPKFEQPVIDAEDAF